jgi:hypothetical protein
MPIILYTSALFTNTWKVWSYPLQPITIIRITYKKISQGGKILQHYNVTYVTEAFKKTHTTFKALDIVINNAGILEDGRWELEIAINVVSRQQ